MSCNYAFFYSRKIPCSLGTIPLAIANHWGLYMPKTSKAVSQGSLLEAASGNGLVGDEPRQNIVAAGYHAKYHPRPTYGPWESQRFEGCSLATEGSMWFWGDGRGIGMEKNYWNSLSPARQARKTTPNSFPTKKGPAVQQYQLLLVQEAPKTAAKGGFLFLRNRNLLEGDILIFWWLSVGCQLSADFLWQSNRRLKWLIHIDIDPNNWMVL